MNSLQHFGFTLTGSTVQWYYNGAARGAKAGTVCTSVYPSPRLVSRPYAWIGYDDGELPFLKYTSLGVDNVKIFKRSLTTTEMNTVYSLF